MTGPQVGTVEGDVLEVLKVMPEASIDVVATSVPYWGQRRYMPGEPREIGTGPLHEYLEALGDVFDEVARVLTADGLVWLNIGDTAAGSGGAGGDYLEGGSYADRNRYRQGDPTVWTHDAGALAGARLMRLPAGQWCDVPGRLAHELQARGWLLRSMVVWAKPKPRREDAAHVRRPKAQHERVLLLAKTTAGGTRYDCANQRFGDVWQLEVAKGDEASGQAPWPTALPRTMLEVSGPPGVVLDPFIGTGNTAVAASRLGWHTVGIDLDAQALAACPGGPVPLEVLAEWLATLRP